MRNNVAMHNIQIKILRLSKKTDIRDLGYRKIGSLIGVEHPQKVKWHLEKLIRDGKLVRETDGRFLPRESSSAGSMIRVPILGRANCGEPLSYAEQEYSQALKLSSTCLPKGIDGKLFALRAVGDSMNKANISGRNIEDGDIVLVDTRVNAPKSGEYIAASVEGLATIKKLNIDKEKSWVVLTPESSSQHNPIVLHKSDSDAYQIHGRVFDVIKLAA